MKQGYCSRRCHRCKKDGSGAVHCRLQLRISGGGEKKEQSESHLSDHHRYRLQRPPFWAYSKRAPQSSHLSIASLAHTALDVVEEKLSVLCASIYLYILAIISGAQRSNAAQDIRELYLGPLLTNDSYKT